MSLCQVLKTITTTNFQNSRGHEFTVVLLDSEGINAADSEKRDDNQIFTLTVLLASVLIYNSQGVPTRHDLEGLEYPLYIIANITSIDDLKFHRLLFFSGRIKKPVIPFPLKPFGQLSC